MTQVFIDHVLDHVMRTLSPMTKRGVTLERVVAKRLPPIVADERRIIQLLSNLIGNALKFTEKVDDWIDAVCFCMIPSEYAL